jgi:hypothetical protein
MSVPALRVMARDVEELHFSGDASKELRYILRILPAGYVVVREYPHGAALKG